MLNESIYRSPKFLRNFLDFEINTGSDIKNDPSKKQLKRIEREKEEKLIKQWKERWVKMDKSLFTEFYKKTFLSKFEYNLNLQDIYKMWVGNFQLWSKYDKWIEDKKTKEKEQNRIEQELNTLMDRILNDFRMNPYSDKFSTPREDGKVTFHYTFENGDKFIRSDDSIIYESNDLRHSYTVGLLFKSKFIKLVNSIINDGGRSRPAWADGSAGESKFKSKPKPKEESKYSSHPKGDLYQRLKETVELRKSQLNKMPKNHPDREVLENELEAAQRAFNTLKSKYKFENLNNFYDFKF